MKRVASLLIVALLALPLSAAPRDRERPSEPGYVTRVVQLVKKLIGLRPSVNDDTTGDEEFRPRPPIP